MKKSEIQVGGHYLAKVSGVVTTVRVDTIRHTTCSSRFDNGATVYDVTNLKTGRRTTFRSAARFRAVASGQKPVSKRFKGDGESDPLAPQTEDKQCSDPTMSGPAQGSEIVPMTTNLVTDPLQDVQQGRCPRCDQTVAVVNGCYSYHRKPSGITCGMSGEKVEKEGKQRQSPLSSGTGSGTSREEGEQSADPTKMTEEPVQSAEDHTTDTTVQEDASLLSKLKHVLPIEDDSPHLIVEARAGTGKTTTLIEGLKYVLGGKSDLTPSPQQKAVWDCMALSAGKAKSICFVAFNKSIATELQRRVPPGCNAMTMHSMGYRAVTKALGRQEPNQHVVQDIIAELLGEDIRWLRANRPVVLKATEELVSLCKMNLVGSDYSDTSIYAKEYWTEKLAGLASYYDVDLNSSRDEVFDLVPRVLERCKQPRGRITFDDMIWLPVVLNLPVTRYDLLLCDELQDFNRCQHALAIKAGKRIIGCGDDFQSIYAFAGAAAGSMALMESRLKANGREVITLPLTVTRRCGKAIVKEARRIVPDFEAHENNSNGRISYANYRDGYAGGSGMAGRVPPGTPGASANLIPDSTADGEGKAARDRPPDQEASDGAQANASPYTGLVQDGDMVLCRVNAPLVSECFRFLKAGRKAVIQGRDVGAGLIATVEKLAKGEDVPQLVGALSDWLHAETTKEQAKRNPSESRLTALQDRHDCLLCFTEGCNAVSEVVAKIEGIFTDDKESPGIRLSSIHKAKGLEARRVFILHPNGVGPRQDKMQPWELEQERNLRYVAITRAIEELVYVS